MDCVSPSVAADRGVGNVQYVPGYGHVSLSQPSTAVMGTRFFHRMRYLLQLGMCHTVFHGATKTRAEYALGVAHLARVIGERAMPATVNRDEAEVLVTCLELAGLLHDVGQMPFTHPMSEALTLHKLRWKKETASAAVFDRIAALPAVREAFRGAGMDASHVQLVRAMILGAPPPERFTDHPWLTEVVRRTRGGFDARVIDYVVRDSSSVGFPVACSPMRVAQTLRTTRGAPYRLVAQADDVLTLKALFESRAMLHLHVYKHPRVVAAELMLQEALECSRTVFPRIKTEVREHGFSALDDNMLTLLSVDECDRTCELALGIREGRYWRVLADGLDNEAARAQAAELYAEDTRGRKLHLSVVHYGEGDRNPLEHVSFCDARGYEIESQSAFKAVQNFMPRSFRYVRYLVFDKLPARAAASLPHAGGAGHDTLLDVFDDAGRLGDEGTDPRSTDDDAGRLGDEGTDPRSTDDDAGRLGDEGTDPRSTDDDVEGMHAPKLQRVASLASLRSRAPASGRRAHVEKRDRARASGKPPLAPRRRSRWDVRQLAGPLPKSASAQRGSAGAASASAGEGANSDRAVSLPFANVTGGREASGEGMGDGAEEEVDEDASATAARERPKQLRSYRRRTRWDVGPLPETTPASLPCFGPSRSIASEDCLSGWVVTDTEGGKFLACLDTVDAVARKFQVDGTALKEALRGSGFARVDGRRGELIVRCRTTVEEDMEPVSYPESLEDLDETERCPSDPSE